MKIAIKGNKKQGAPSQVISRSYNKDKFNINDKRT